MFVKTSELLQFAKNRLFITREFYVKQCETMIKRGFPDVVFLVPDVH